MKILLKLFFLAALSSPISAFSDLGEIKCEAFLLAEIIPYCKSGDLTEETHSELTRKILKFDQLCSGIIQMFHGLHPKEDGEESERMVGVSTTVKAGGDTCWLSTRVKETELFPQP